MKIAVVLLPQVHTFFSLRLPQGSLIAIRQYDGNFNGLEIATVEQYR
jgi:hypothetical protein